jgi:hypothetical protein
MRCCIASSTTSRLKDQHNSAHAPPPAMGSLVTRASMARLLSSRSIGWALSRFRACRDTNVTAKEFASARFGPVFQEDISDASTPEILDWRPAP